MSKIQGFTKIQGLNEKDDISTQDYLVATSLQHVIAGMINIQLFLAPAIVMYIILYIRPYSNIFFYITFVCIIFLIIFPAWESYRMRTQWQFIGKKIMGSG